MRTWALGLGALLVAAACTSESDRIGEPESPPAEVPSGFPDDFYAETGNEPRGEVETAPAPQGPAADAQPPAAVVAGQLAVTVGEPAPSVRLNETREFSALVTPGSGFSGLVTLSVEGLPAGVTATLTPPSAQVTAPLTVKLALKVASDATAQASIPLTLKATAGTLSGSAPFALTVPPELLIEIAPNVALGTAAAPNQMAFGSTTIPVTFVAAGTKVTFINRDAKNHEIHATGVGGLKHEPGALLANSANAYTSALTTPGTTIPFRCHIHPNMIGQIVVK